jgi:hypothetical protein
MRESVRGIASRWPTFNSKYPSSTLHVGPAEVRVERSVFHDILWRRDNLLRVECRGVRLRQRMWFARLVFIDQHGKASAVRFQPNNTEQAITLLETMGWPVTYL